MARYILVYNHPEKGEQRFELDNDRSYRIGSKADNDIVLRQNDVSRNHAILRVRDGAFNITDLNSKNGTYVNGQRTAAASLKCGDLINVSSARLVVVEVASGSYSLGGEAQTDSSSGGGRPLREDTLGYSGEASAEDMISLLITTSSAVRRGALAEPLTWAVDRFGLEAVAVLYRDKDDNVAMVSSAGDLGPLVRSSGTLARLVREQKGYRAGTRIQQVSELEETLLVAPIQRDHVLVVRFEGPPPAIGDIRAVIAAVEAVLCSGNPPSPNGTDDRRDPEARQFGSPMQRIAGLSDSIVECKRKMVELARRNEPVLITGEPGSGKSLFARVLHDISARHEEDFVVFDCGRELPGRFQELLFGNAEGDDGGPGAMQRAAGGTLYLKSVCEVPIELQAGLLDQLCTGVADAPELRILAGTEEKLELAVAEGRLRQDLLSVLGGLRIDLPPLRERSEDIPLLVTAFQREGGARRQHTGGFTVDALEALAHYQWPHNVAELRREVLRLITNVPEGTVIELSDLAPHITEALAGHSVRPPDLGALAQRPLAEARADFERWRILRALHDSGGNQSRAAMDLGLSRAGLFKKMRRLGLTANHNRDA